MDVREGFLFEPVAGEKFDLITCNAPYVVSPETTYLFRDGGMSGDAVSEHVVRATPAALAPGACCFYSEELGAVFTGESLGRHYTSTGGVHVVRLNTRTPGATNASIGVHVEDTPAGPRWRHGAPAE